MLEREIKVLNPLGLHARAAARLVRLVATFSSEITLNRTDNGVMADAKSILSVLTLAATQGTVLRLEISGPDDRAALEAVEDIFTRGFNEI
jgi:phosphocarrier protein HPr